MDSKRVLIVEDDELLAGALEAKLLRNGFDVTLAYAGADGRELIATEQPDAVLLDLMLPDEDGMEICRDVRVRSDLAIIIITARTEEPYRIAGFEAGADDYLTKPFSLAELTARVNAILRRKRAARERPKVEEPTCLDGFGISINLHTCETRVDGEPVRLTPTEYKLLVELVKHAGRLRTKTQLLRVGWSAEQDDERLIMPHMTSLRRKIDSSGNRQARIQNVRAIGYRLATASAE